MRGFLSKKMLGLLALVIGAVAFAIWYGYRHRGPTCGDEFDLVITGAEIIDGSGRPAFRADIGIRDRRIACIGDLHIARTKSVIDATGLTVAPGFIDVHTHIERNFKPDAPFLAPNFLRQGVTTVITGNCGRSVLDVGKFFKQLEANGSHVNIATLIGHNTVRSSVMKQRPSVPSNAEMAKLEDLVARAIHDGALGLSTGLVYVPGTFAKKEELVRLAQIAAKANGLYVSHVRDEAAKGREAIAEAISIGEETGVHVHISHFKAQGPNQWGSAQSLLDLVQSAIDRGLNVSLDQYPYTASSTGLAVLLPSWLSDADFGTAKQKLQDPSMRRRVRDEMLLQLKRNGWKDYAFAKIAYYQFDQSLVGLNIAEIARKRNSQSLAAPVALVRSALVHSESRQEPATESDLERQAETVIDLYSHGGAQMVFFDMSEDDVQTIMKNPRVMFGSDSGVREESGSVLPHPRGLGTFPRVLGLYAREKGLFSIEEAVRRMTSLPALTFNLKGRGVIQPNNWADLVIFDQQSIVDTATFDKPFSPPRGIAYVIVNGSVVLSHNQISNSLPGVGLKHDCSLMLLAETWRLMAKASAGNSPSRYFRQPASKSPRRCSRSACRRRRRCRSRLRG
jgi:N-acyl-D-amino-acid deacylase